MPLSFEIRVFTCCVDGEDMLRNVLVEGLPSEMYEGRLIMKVSRTGSGV